MSRLARALAVAADRPEGWWRQRVVASRASLQWSAVDVRVRSYRGGGGRETERVPLRVEGPEDAWEAMASSGLVGPDDIENERRRFAGPFERSAEWDASSPDAEPPDPRDAPAGAVLLDRETRLGWRCERDARRPEGAWVPYRRLQDEPAPQGRKVYGPAERVVLYPRSVADAVALAGDWRRVLAAEELARQLYRGARRRIAWRCGGGTAWADAGNERRRIAHRAAAGRDVSTPLEQLITDGFAVEETRGSIETLLMFPGL